MSKLLPYFKLIRLPAGFTALSNILAASIIVSNGQISSGIVYLLGASVSLYFAGMTLNDCFDFKEDLRERPQRPIPSKQVSLKKAWSIGAILLCLGVCLSLLHSAVSAGIAIVLSILIILYNSVFKKGLLGSFCMASCRYLNWLLGASFPLAAYSFSEDIWQLNFLIALPIFFYIAGLTFLSKQETTAQNKQAIGVCAGLLLLSVATCCYLVEQYFQLTCAKQLISYGLIALCALIMARKLIAVFNDFTPSNIQRLIGFMVMGVIPLDALLTALAGHYLYSMLILALLLPSRLVGKRLYVT
ncbi:UbiA family prenyltransferase [Agaribacter flavus]|uniref:UbiA family prenyltransferase n=1 Tax=Agaribacter flavus TaxID=1902781 RepID=A0ABV7FNS7_9ALTE